MTTSAPAHDANSKAATALCALWQWVKAEVEHFDGPMPDDFIVDLVEDALTTAKTAAQRQADRKARELAAGRVHWKRWVHPDDVQAMAQYADKLASRRDRGTKKAG